MKTIDQNQVAKLWEQYRAHVNVKEEPTDEWKPLRDKIILTYYPMTETVALKMRRKFPSHIEKDDLQQWATEGLMEAVQSFDPDRGVLFEAFASRRMYGKILDGIRKLDWAPRALRQQQRNISKAEERLQSTLNRPATDTELSEELGISVDEIAIVRRRSDAAAPSYIEEVGDNLTGHSTTDPEQADYLRRVRESFVAAVKELDYLEQVVVVLYYYSGKKLSQIATMKYLTDAKVGQIHAEAILKIWPKIQASAEM